MQRSGEEIDVNSEANKQLERCTAVAISTRHLQRAVAKQRIMPMTYRRLFCRGTPQDERHFLEGIGQRLGHETVAIPIGRARAGIYLLVKLATRGERRRVLLSPFTIPDVVTMVTLAGGVPVFYDFEQASTACRIASLASLIDDRTACVLITHYHVNEPHLMQIAELCRDHGAYLFDDCALSFGGSIHGQPIGTLTDASVFSLSSFKLLNYVWGGLITTRDPKIARTISDLVETWPRLTSRDYLAPARASLAYDLASRPPLFDLLVFPLFRRRAKHSEVRSLEHGRIETAAINHTLTSRPSLTAFAEWARKLKSVESWLSHRRRLAEIYRARLGHRMVTADTPDSIFAGSCFTNFPVVVPHERCTEIARAMILSGYDVGRSLYPNLHRHPKFISVEGNSHNIDRLVNSTIYLPTHFGVTPNYAEAIAAKLSDEIGH